MKKHNLLSHRLITPVAFIAVVTCFLLFRPAQPGSVYWFNFIWSVSITVGISLYFTRTRLTGEKVSIPIAIALGSYAVVYALMLFVVMCAYFALIEPGVIWILADFPSPFANLLRKLAPLFQENPELGRGIYFAVFVVITAAFGISLAFILRHDTSIRAYTKEINQRTQEQRNYAFSMQSLSARMESISKNKGLEFSTMSIGKTPFSRLADAFRALTPNVMANATARAELDRLMTEGEALADKLSAASGETQEECKADIEQFVEKAMSQLQILKQYSKK